MLHAQCFQLACKLIKRLYVNRTANLYLHLVLTHMMYRLFDMWYTTDVLLLQMSGSKAFVMCSIRSRTQQWHVRDSTRPSREMSWQQRQGCKAEGWTGCYGCYGMRYVMTCNFFFCKQFTRLCHLLFAYTVLQFTAVSCHVMSCHVMSCYVTELET